MKTLLIILFPLLSFGQRQVYEHGLKASSGFYFNRNDYCYFEAFNGSNNVVLKIKTSKPIIGGVFIFTTQNHKYALKIEGVNKRDYYIINLPFYNKDLWYSLNFGINRIEFLIGSTFEKIIINDKLTKLKEYAK